MKRAFLMILSMAMILSLAACGSSGGQSAGTPPAQQPAGSQQPESARPDGSPAEEPEPSGGGKTLVVYYSATGHTAAVAGTIAQAREGDLFEIVPADPYSSEDLNWRDRGSRVSREHDDPALREMELAAATVDGWDEYDTVFIGYLKQRRPRWSEAAELYLRYLSEEVRAVRDTQRPQQG